MHTCMYSTQHIYIYNNIYRHIINAMPIGNPVTIPQYRWYLHQGYTRHQSTWGKDSYEKHTTFTSYNLVNLFHHFINTLSTITPLHRYHEPFTPYSRVSSFHHFISIIFTIISLNFCPKNKDNYGLNFKDVHTIHQHDSDSTIIIIAWY